jgi:hypothetical protein
MDGSAGFGENDKAMEQEARFEFWWQNNFAANEGSEALAWVKNQVRPICYLMMAKGVPLFFLSDFLKAIRLHGYEPVVKGGGSPDAPVGGTPVAASLDRLAA